MRRRTTFNRTIKHSNSTTTSRFMVSRSGNGRRRRTRVSNEGSCRERGFSTRLNPSAWVRAVHKFNSVIVTTRFRSMHIPISIRTNDTMADIKALVDSGATDCFISERFIQHMKLGKRPLQRPRKIWNIDNTANQAGEITHYITLDIQTRGVQKTIQFLITNIGNEDIILGYPWMAAFEPQFSWKNGVINEKELPVILQSVNPFTPRKGPNNRTNRKQRPTSSHDLHRTRDQSATIYKTSGGPNRAPTIRQSIQQTRIKTIPTKTSMGSRNRVQKRCAQSSRLQDLSYELDRG